ncbi:metallophosphoesterase [Candidatus Dojkabacteria bacterium]|jgi:DNA repair exonuclease SbcCD ATPase subunit|nr:metallophosphoesterase [Candidatus Dojkabacteria bacterium]
MIRLIQIADIHIKNTERHEEYKIQFEKLYKIIIDNNINIIAIIGDLFDNYIEISNEAKILAGEFLNNLSKIVDEVVIVFGNHDLRKKNLNRINSIETVIKLIDNPKVTYFDKSGFFNDNIYDIVWVNHSHQEKNINPWNDIPHLKDNSKIYIDLFHDPVNGSIDTNKSFQDKKYRNIEDFKGDISLLGDIHKHQSLGKKHKIVYPSSLIQQHFGEDLIHGCVIWDIKSSKDITWEFVNIENDHTFINLYVDQIDDYDKLSLTIPNITSDVEIKVHWKDLSSIMTTINERKIRDYIKNKFNTTRIVFEKTFIYTDVISSTMLSESLDLTDLKVQTNIFKEYLTEQKYKKEDIDEILKIDEIINSRLHLSNNKTNIEWNIEKFWFTNFKSYDDDNEVDWSDIDGLIQITGPNQAGKTTILDIITYILFGKTTTTLSPEKFGDNRYINNKRDLDFCEGGAIINANGNKYVIQRRTERQWNKNKTAITACPTTLDLYKNENISEDNKLTGEIKTKTQKDLDLILGDLKDFIRLSFTNADTLNNSLSETRSVFIDNIIRDAGYDVFEYKLEEFKDYKKELAEEKIIIDIQESEKQIIDLKSDIGIFSEKIQYNEEIIDEIEIDLNSQNLKRDELNRNLNIIDESIYSFDENINLNSIENYKNKIIESNSHLVSLTKEIDDLPKIFDVENLNNLKLKLKETNDIISERKEEIFKVKNLIIESDNKIDKIKSKIIELKDSEIKKYQLNISENNLKIEKIKNKKDVIINDEISKIKNQLQKIELEKNNINNNIKSLQKDGTTLKNANGEYDKEIEELKNSSACPSCGREYDKNDPKYSEHLAHLEDNIKQRLIKKQENENEIKNLLTEYKKLKNSLSEFDNDENELKLQKNNILQGIYSNDITNKLLEIDDINLLIVENDNIKKLIEEIRNNNFDNVIILKENITKGNQLIFNAEKTKETNLQNIKNIEAELKNINIESIESNIQLEEQKKEKVEWRSKKISQKDNILLSIENFKFKIKEYQLEIDKYQDFKSKIEDNKNIQLSISDIDKNILEIKENIKKLSEENIDSEKNILVKENEIDMISNRIRKFLKQKKREELLKEYSKCIGRDGIPTFLFKKSIHLINKELNDLLTNVDFTLFFDDDLVLRMSMNDRLDVSQNAIESSGMERTFCALALKMALRQINVKSKSNFITLDEMTGKLINESIDKFMNFLDMLKTKINKIVIIEHIHPIEYNALIEVNKDENLISHLKLII